MLSQIQTILVHNSHPGNIGASARALKNMGLSHLALVAPKAFPSEEAEARASHALDILANARVFKSLEEALSGASWVLGCSARQRKLSLPLLSPKEAALQVKAHLGAASGHTQQVAILYGNEQSGLSNDELAFCAAQICIPTVSEYASLNLAQAVQIISYELFLALSDGYAEQDFQKSGAQGDRPSYETLAEFYQELEKICIHTQFLDPNQPGQMMRRFKHVFSRAGLDRTELTLLRGLLSAIQKKIK